MGIEGATLQEKAEKIEGTAQTKGWIENTEGSKKAVCQKEKYNCITIDEILKESKNLYNNIQGMYTSDLINSFAWDTALVYIDKCSGKKDYAFQTDSSGKLSKTGEKNDEECKINDMAGNAIEWTTERANYGDLNGIIRGGNYYNSEICASDRNGASSSQVGNSLGFRPILYLDS